MRSSYRVFFAILAIGMAWTLTGNAGHRLVDSRCQDCHVIGGSLSDVVDQSHLIKADENMAEILNGGTWSVGNPLPCIYCHDGTPRSVRENQIGVKNHFTDASLSRHPVDPYKSSSQDDPASLDCIDCHDGAVVEYVRNGVPSGSALAPNIHERNVAAVGWTPEPGLLSHTATYKDWAGGAADDPTNSGNNSFCTNQCHDALPGTGYDSGQVYHSFSGPLVSLEKGSSYYTASQIAGCLNEGVASGGCHGVHNALDSTDLITASRWGTTATISRDDCGSCHVFDDPPSNRSLSDYFAQGHGQFTVGCLNCHNSAVPHFQTDGTPVTGSQAGRLGFVLDPNNSGFSSPPKSETSICISSSCHSGYLKHTANTSGTIPAGPVVACLDCHDPHGGGVSGNVAMIRRTPPVSSPASSLYYASQGSWYNSTSPPASGNFSNFVCDQVACHGGSGPGPYVDIGGVHTGIVGGCDSCHVHTGTDYSWEPPPCDTCHGYPPTGGGFVDHTAGLTSPLNASGLMGAHDDCLLCHGKKDEVSHSSYLSTFHGDGSVSMNSDLGYDGNGGCDAACHANDAVHRMGTSSSRAHTLTAFGSGDSATCGFCHDGGAYGAVAIPVATSPHLDADGSGSAWSQGECRGCHAGHAGAAGAVTIPLPPSSWSDPSGRLTGTDMQTRLGIAYAGTGHNGIALGGQGTAASAYTTEAETCWGCHSGLSTPVSEWGYNTKTNTTMGGFATVWSSFPTQHDGTAQSRNYGWIYQSGYTTPVTDWTAGFWMSEYDYLLKRRIASVHTVSFDAAGQSSSVGSNVVPGTNKVRQGPGGNPYGDTALTPLLEDVRYIRCSYCHDVHDTFGPGGKPYLRGAWVGDPYPPELPPRNTYTYTTRVPTVGSLSYSPYMPRGKSTARDRGGYFIDQNSGWPTTNIAMDTVTETAQLCTLCHGTNIDTMDFYTSSSLWRFAPPGKNGHSNAALGGSRNGSLISDLFTGLRYNAGMGMQLSAGTCPGWLGSDIWPCGADGLIGDCDTQIPLSTYYAHYCDPGDEQVVGNSGWYDGDYSNWYGSGTIGGASAPGAKAHDFTCSKCHSPHASGLPALLPQNCIDPLLGNFTFTTSNNPNTYRGNNQMANNCHRKTVITDGWHKLAPRQ